MKKVLFSIFISLSVLLFSNGSNDPNNKIYRDIDIWYGAGLIDRLPPIRPYSSQYIISILKDIEAKGVPSDALKAKKYLSEYVNNSIDSTIYSHNYYNFDEVKTISGFGLEGNVNPHKNVYGNIDFGMNLLNRTEDNFFPTIKSMNLDYNDDDANVSVKGITLDIFQSLNISSSFGTDSMWFQSGVMRSSFGPLFSDSVVLNSSASQATHFSYTWMHKNFTLSYLLLPILASDNYGEGLRDDKYVSIKSYDFYFFDWWNFQFYESVTYGRGGVKPEYLLPFGQFFYSAGLSQTLDVNSMMGLSSTFRLPNNFNLKGTFYMDDINFNELIKFNLDSKMKVAAQFNLDWTPNKTDIKKISLTYTAILPYMYTHIDYEDNSERVDDNGNEVNTDGLFNYQNYTHKGISLGPYNMDPNSDKLSLSFIGQLKNNIGINLSLNLQRHGNASEGVDESIATDNSNQDGSVFDTGFSNLGRYLYNNSNPFLTQDIIETIFSSEVEITTVDYVLDKGVINFALGYIYAFTNNRDLVNGKKTNDNLVSFSINYKL